MKLTPRKTFLAAALAGVLVAGPAFAIRGYSTAHLNLRAGPGTQYPVVGVMEYNVRSDITGCLADYSWCSINVAGLSGWASAEYLVVDKGGSIMQVDEQGAATGIPVVEAEGVAEVVAGPTVGVVVGPAGNVAAIVPEPAVIQYISATPVPAVAVQGEIVHRRGAAGRSAALRSAGRRLRLRHRQRQQGARRRELARRPLHPPRLSRSACPCFSNREDPDD